MDDDDHLNSESAPLPLQRVGMRFFPPTSTSMLKINSLGGGQGRRLEEEKQDPSASGRSDEAEGRGGRRVDKVSMAFSSPKSSMQDHRDKAGDEHSSKMMIHNRPIKINFMMQQSPINNPRNDTSSTNIDSFALVRDESGPAQLQDDDERNNMQKNNLHHLLGDFGDTYADSLDPFLIRDLVLDPGQTKEAEKKPTQFQSQPAEPGPINAQMQALGK